MNPPKPNVVGSALFSVGYTLSTLLFGVCAVFTFPFPFRARYRFITQWTRFNIWWLKITCGLTFQVEGSENIPTEPAIIFCKHQSAWETLALQLIFPPQVWVMKRELLWLPFFGWGLAVLDPIAIDRQGGLRAMRQLLEQGTDRLRTGRWVVIYPEGTRVPPGEHKPFQPGGAKLAQHSKNKVIPVAHNAGCFWPRRSFLKRPGVIRVIIGAPIDTAGKSAKEINQQAEQWINETADGLVDKS